LQGSRQIAEVMKLVDAGQRHRSALQQLAIGHPGAGEALAGLPTSIWPPHWPHWLSRMAQTRQAPHGPVTRLPSCSPGGRLLTESTDPMPANLWQRQTDMLAALSDLLHRIGDDSRLLLDPDSASYQLMDLALLQVPAWSDALTSLTDLAAAKMASDVLPDAERHQMVAQALRVRERLREMDRRGSALQRSGEPLPAGWEASRRLGEELVSVSLALLDEAARPDSVRSLLEAGAQASHAAHHLGTAARLRLEEELRQRQLQAVQIVALQLALFLAVACVMLYLGLAMFRNYRQTVHGLQRAVQAVSQGDLTHRCGTGGELELAGIATALTEMSRRLSGTVSEVRSTATRLSTASLQLSTDATALAQRTESQAVSLSQTAASVRHLNATVEDTARRARAVTQRAEQARSVADEGRQSMREVVSTMQAIEDGARRTHEIVGVIEDIAFQTNMLSLNASVEAAKAGESGKGFAVVADEVRKLAQRSSQAAQEVSTLLEDSSRQIGEGATRIAAMDLTLGDITTGVREVAETLSVIADAAGRQSQSIGELTSTIGDLNGITRDNAAMVRASHQATQSLMGQADDLNLAVREIRLWQGSSDEALALVHQAAELIRELGLEAAQPILHSRDGGFRDRDLYIFAFDRQGIYRVCGTDPSLVGQAAAHPRTARGGAAHGPSPPAPAALRRWAWRGCPRRGRGGRRSPPGGLTGAVDRGLGRADGAGRLDRDAHHQVLPGGDATQHAAGMVAGESPGA
jgi:methyl-accepting chemotaxis protein